ncbi:hypothetical protein ASPWEDRAFT_283835 [Aspergillus wentii DTO 134E9]|uniref:Uncharacterized protein n=1 Tax=Aspergillus wentii DTO 134E9 TaxID=1073089 RepID=A0A1L9S3I6_ASPWE|nr:uncharacterized protein ASPWEDRAFT_283835 [Aspergillus wentii DTO 134E9]OJJ41717.1 hypothetical protein ASPWEDRAFT_283835 [Aspergillus wentii DTO 134E9]
MHWTAMRNIHLAVQWVEFKWIASRISPPMPIPCLFCLYIVYLAHASQIIAINFNIVAVDAKPPYELGAWQSVLTDAWTTIKDRNQEDVAHWNGFQLHDVRKS